MKQNRFLAAEWRKLIMANYTVDPGLLKPFLPFKTELDLWDDKCYLSLVGFQFSRVKVKGISVPFHKNFPEVNLRFYVRYKENQEWKRGVVFIREIVPKPAITFVANTIFDEHYATMSMRSSLLVNGNQQTVSYEWKKRGKWNTIKAIAGTHPSPLLAGSEEEFITEHFWGYSAKGNKSTTEYHVSHPRWDIYKVSRYHIDCDFSNVYGKEYAFLREERPVSVFLAEGSEVSVFMKKVL